MHAKSIHSELIHSCMSSNGINFQKVGHYLYENRRYKKMALCFLFFLFSVIKKKKKKARCVH